MPPFPGMAPAANLRLVIEGNILKCVRNLRELVCGVVRKDKIRRSRSARRSGGETLPRRPVGKLQTILSSIEINASGVTR